MRVALHNFVAAISITAFLFLSQALAPHSHSKEANLSCVTGLSMSFDSMKACTSSPDYRQGCGCGPRSNPWSKTYHWGLAPLLTAFVGLATLRGRLITQLFVLNTTIALVLLEQLIVGIQQHDSAVMLIPIMPVIAAVVCGIVSGWFLLLRFGYHKLWEGKHAT